MTRLMRMTALEFESFIAEAVPAYAADKTLSGQWHPAHALDLSKAAFAELLPQGLATPDNHLFTIRDAAGPAAIGSLWIAAQAQAGQRIAYVYEVNVHPEQRRRGHARRAFLVLETEVAALGLAGIALHVFGHNAAARALYESLGYATTDLNMYKPVEQGDADTAAPAATATAAPQLPPP